MPNSNYTTSLLADQSGSGILEKVAIIGAVAVPLFVILYKIAKKVLGWGEDANNTPEFRPIK